MRAADRNPAMQLKLLLLLPHSSPPASAEFPA